ncbi:MAG: hypothetical protein AB8I08_01085 [Sandaracinaceae bacterium]
MSRRTGTTLSGIMGFGGLLAATVMAFTGVERVLVVIVTLVSASALVGWLRERRRNTDADPD